MKPQMHLVEISIFSLNHVIVRPTKIIKDLCEIESVYVLALWVPLIILEGLMMT